MDVWNIERYEARSRTTRLQMMRDRLVRAYIISHYTLMDELLTDVMCNYYFHRPKITLMEAFGERNDSGCLYTT